MQVKIDYDNDDGHDSDFEVSEEEVDDEVSGRDERGGILIIILILREKNMIFM